MPKSLVLVFLILCATKPVLGSDSVPETANTSVFGRILESPEWSEHESANSMAKVQDFNARDSLNLSKDSTFAPETSLVSKVPQTVWLAIVLAQIFFGTGYLIVTKFLIPSSR